MGTSALQQFPGESTKNKKMKFFILLSFCTILVPSDGVFISRDRPDEGAEWEDAYLDPISMIKKYKYPAEQHDIITSDGYILGTQRIPYGRTCTKEKIKGPIILQHGILGSSVYWILAGTKKGLAYILADSCYDVWMPNSRGNSLSLRHVKYTVRDPEYWNFTWHEMGIYDLPAVFDYVLNATAAENVTYVGYSQGTTSFLVFNIFHPEYNDKIRAAFLMAPIAFMGNSKSVFLQFLSRLAKPIMKAVELVGIYDLVQQRSILSDAIDIACTYLKPISPVICQNLLFLVTGFDNEQANSTFFSIFFKNEPYGTSLKQLTHYAQLIKSGNFQQFDYNEENVRVYGRKTPPQYDLTTALAPIHLYMGVNDFLSDLVDVMRLMRKLPNIQQHYLVPHHKFNHLDHQFAKDIIDLEYDNLVHQIDNYYKQI